MADAATLDAPTDLPPHAEVLILAAEMAADQGVDLAAFLEANPDALAEFQREAEAESAPIDLSGEDDPE